MVSTTVLYGIKMAEPWTHIVDSLNTEVTGHTGIVTKKDFEKFDKEYIFDAVNGLRYGQAFCNKFNITDYILASTVNVEACKKYINKIYIR